MASSISKTKASARIFLFHGRDDYTSSRKLAVWIEAFAKKYGKSGIVQLDAAEEQEVALRWAAGIGSGGLFSQTRLVVVKDLFTQKVQVQEPIIDTLDQLPDDLYAVFWERTPVKKALRLYKKIASLETSGRSRIQAFDMPSGGALSRFISEYAVQKDIHMTKDAIERLAVLLGRDLTTRIKTSSGYESREVYTLWEVVSELDKLAAYGAGATISAAEVAALVNGRESDSIFRLTDAIGNRDKATASQLLEKVMNAGSDTASDEKTTAIMVVGSLAGQYRSLLLAAAGRTSYHTALALAAALGWNPYRAQAMLRLAGKFNVRDLTQGLYRLRQIDIQLKSSALPPRVLLAKFIAS